MSACKTLLCASLSSFKCTLSPIPPSLSLSSLLLHPRAAGLRVTSRCYLSAQRGVSMEAIDSTDEASSPSSITEEPHEDQSSEKPIQHLLTSNDEVSRLMKMERKVLLQHGVAESRWFPYLDKFKCGNACLSSGEIIEAVSPCISDLRKERFRNVVRNRSYSVCLVVEGLCDFGNVSATFRSADALGVQSVHVVSCDSNKRCIVKTVEV